MPPWSRSWKSCCPALNVRLVHELGDGGALAVVHRREERDVLQKRGIGRHARMLAWI